MQKDLLEESNKYDRKSTENLTFTLPNMHPRKDRWNEENKGEDVLNTKIMELNLLLSYKSVSNSKRHHLSN